MDRKIDINLVMKSALNRVGIPPNYIDDKVSNYGDTQILVDWLKDTETKKDLTNGQGWHIYGDADKSTDLFFVFTGASLLNKGANFAKFYTNYILDDVFDKNEELYEEVQDSDVLVWYDFEYRDLKSYSEREINKIASFFNYWFGINRAVYTLGTLSYEDCIKKGLWNVGLLKSLQKRNKQFECKIGGSI